MSPTGYPIDRIYRKQGGQEMVFPAGTTLNMQGGAIVGMMPTTDYFVDGENGSDDDAGKAWGTAFESIQQAMDAITALGAQRGRSRVFVAPYGYAEDIVTPTNAIAPFGQLIAVNPTRRSGGAVWLISSTVTSPALTIRARGWLVEGFEFDANSGSGGGGILLSGANAKFANIRNNLFIGSSQAGAYGIKTDTPNPLVVIEDNWFLGFAGRCIDATDYPLQWEIARNLFENSAKYIAPSNTKGFQQAWIHDNNFNHISGDYTAVIKIDMRGGAQNHIGPNNFLGSTYDNAGGYYASATDTWRGNHSEDSDSGTTGTGQVNPAA